MLMTLFTAFLAPPMLPALTSPAIVSGTIGAPTTFTFKGVNLDEANALFIDENRIEAEFRQVERKSVTVRFTVPRLAVGLHLIRIATPAGISNPRAFAIDDLPQVRAGEGRTKRDTAHVIESPCIIAGVTTNDASDFFRWKAVPNERLTIEVVGRRLGSAIDPVLILHDSKTFKELPGLYADDTIGLQSDARLTHTFEKQQEILIELRDTTFRGGLEYRLRIGTFPNAIGTLPLRADRKQDIQTFGESEPQALSAGNRTAPALVAPEREQKTTRGWGVSLHHSEIPVIPHRGGDFDQAAICTIPFGSSSVFRTKNQRDHFAMELKKADKIQVIAEASEFALPTEIFLRVLDKDARELAASDPMKLPASIDFDAPSDGRYVVVAEHLNFSHGKLEAYHLSVRHRMPDASVELGSDRVTTPGFLDITKVTRHHGHEAALDLKWDGPPGVIVNATLPPKANPTNKFPLQLEVKSDGKPGVYFGRITSQAKGRPARFVSTSESLRKDIPNLPVLPAEMNGVIAVVVPAR